MEPSEYCFSTSWPAPRKRWKGEVHKVGVYAIVWENHAYVGMTVASQGFKARWAKHYRNMFVKKRASAHPKLRGLVKDAQLTADDFRLYALTAHEPGAEGLTKTLTDRIALEEQHHYDSLQKQGFSMLNSMRPHGAGYVTSTTVAEGKPLVTQETAEGAVTVIIQGVDEARRKWTVRARAVPTGLP